METPSSVKRITRPTASIKSPKRKNKTLASRPTLSDITNDSPITGVAKEDSTIKAPNRVQACKNTPGSGESLLIGQVKRFLQKVEEEAEFLTKISAEERPPFRVVLELPAPSPVQMMAPTPANTPQVNVSLEDEDEEEGCDEISRISMHEDIKVELPEFEGRHTRFVYGSDDEEIKGEELVVHDRVVSTKAVVLKGLPGPQGKHLRFHEEIKGEELVVHERVVSTKAVVLKGLPVPQGKHLRFHEEIKGEELVVHERVVSTKAVVLKGLPVPQGKHLRFHEEIKGEELVVHERAVSTKAVVLKGLPVPQGKHLRFHEEEEDEDC